MFLFSDTYKFKEAANTYEKEGRYCLETSPRLITQWWDREWDRIDQGMTINGVRITGEHYWYLNYNPILRLPEEFYGKNINIDDLIARGVDITKMLLSPAFWDLDYEWFHTVERAKKEQKHIVVLKARGKGFSYKAASMGVRKMVRYKKSKSFYMADNKEFLIKDGVLNKCWDSINHVNRSTAFSKRLQYKNTTLHKRFSYGKYVDGREVESGYMSEIIGVAIKGDPGKARGKRGDYIFWEEGGSFPKLLKCWEVARPSVETGKFVVGTMIAFGTGGEEGADFDALQELFYNPNAYNVLSFDNVWDEGFTGTDCGYFVPDYKCLDGFIDPDGNSMLKEAKNFEIKERKIIEKESNDPNALDTRAAEHCHTPQEACLNTSNNPFPTKGILKHLNYIRTKKIYKDIALKGTLIPDKSKSSGVSFQIDLTLKEVIKFPHSKKNDNSGCIVTYQDPIRSKDGEVLDNLYILCHDPYDHDESQSGESLGSAYVIKRINNVSRPDDMIVASYVGRPESQDEYNRILFNLAAYYNAKISFENDRGGVIAYAKRFNRIHQLQEEFDITINSNKLKILNRKYGISLGSKVRKAQGILLLKDWLNRKRGFDDNGEFIYNYHKIYDLALLTELIRYNPEGNFDRIMSLCVGMYYLNELQDTVVKEENSEIDENSFWNRGFFK